MPSEHAYAGLKVVDLSQGIAGPYCGMLLALYGADVVKVEPPQGDWIRALGRRWGDHSAAGLANNRGKRSLALDLKAPAGQAAVRRLAAAADVFIESFRPGVAAALGLGYPALSALNPRLLYISVSGFGQTGPYAGRPCTDLVAQAFSGLISSNRGADGMPHRVTALVVDQVTGLQAFQALQAALYVRRDGGAGRHLDVSLMAGAASLQAAQLVAAALEGASPQPANVPTGSYATADGWIVLAVVKEAQWQALARAIGRPDLLTDGRLGSFAGRAAHQHEVVAAVAAALAARDTAHWQAALGAADILCERVNTHADWLADPHVQAVAAAPAVAQAGVGPVPALQLPGLPPVDPADPRQQVPAIGADGRAVLAEAGFSEAEIERLVAEGALRLPAVAASAA